MADNMIFKPSQDTDAADKVQALLNAGLFYTLKHKKSGAVISHHRSYEEAKGKKTRKTRVTLTRNLLIKTEKQDHGEVKKSRC